MLAATKSVLVLGGTGVFGRRIAQHLLLHGNLNNVDIHVVGRDAAKLTRIKNELLAGQASALACKNVRLEVHSVDIYQPTALDAVLEAVCPAVTIDAVGPFRSRSFATARACLEAGSHFLDLADDPEYVSHFPAAVDAFARDANKVAITGCSTTPGLTSTAVAALAKTYFEDNEVVSVDVSMAPGNKLPRGLATVQKVVSDIGSRFATLRGGAWRETTGWATIEERTFPGIGARLVGQCNVPDNVLVPQMLLSRGEEERERRAEAAAQCQQSSLKDSSFWAGLELSPLVRVLGALARFLPSVDYGRFAPLFLHASKWFAGIGSADGGMKVRMRGRPRGGGGGGAGARTTMLRTVEWSLFAGSGDGPMTPSILSAMLACRLLEQPAAASSSSSNSSAAESGGSRLRVGAGAHPCVNLVSLRDFEDEVAPYDFSFHRRVADGGECDTYTLGDILSVDAKGNLPPFFEDFHFGHRAESAEVAGSFRVGGHSNGIVAAVTQTVAGAPLTFLQNLVLVGASFRCVREVVTLVLVLTLWRRVSTTR